MRTLEAYEVSARRALRPGMTFRTIRGSGPVYGKTPVGEFGEFRCRRLYRRGRRRVYAEAVNIKSGCCHELYLDGPSYRGLSGTTERPYRIRLTGGER